MVRYYLSEDSEKYFKELVSDGFLDIESFNNLLLCKSLSDFESFFNNFFSLDRYKIDSIWRFVRDSVWENNYFDNFNGSFFVFNSFESLFFHHLLSKGGILSTSSCKSLKFPHGRLKSFLSGNNDLFSHGCLSVLSIDNGRHEKSVRFIILNISLFNKSIGGL